MAPKKPGKPKQSDRHKPGRMVRVPERWCVVLEEIAAAHENTITDQVKIAVRLYLEQLGRLPKPL